MTCEEEDPSRGGWSDSDGDGGGGGGRPDWGDGHGPNHSHSTDGRTDVDGLDCTATRHGALLLSVRPRPSPAPPRAVLPSAAPFLFLGTPRSLPRIQKSEQKGLRCVACGTVRVATCWAWQGGHSRPARTCIAFHAVSTSSHTVSLAPREARCSDLSTQNGIKRVITQSAGRTSRSLIPVFTRKIWAVRSEALLRPYFILSTQGGRGTVCSHVLYCTYASWASSVCECWLRSIQHSYHQSIV